MNIAQAKEEIRHTVEAYLKKDEAGRYRIYNYASYQTKRSGTSDDCRGMF